MSSVPNRDESCAEQRWVFAEMRWVLCRIEMSSLLSRNELCTKHRLVLCRIETSAVPSRDKSCAEWELSFIPKWELRMRERCKFYPKYERIQKTMSTAFKKCQSVFLLLHKVCGSLLRTPLLCQYRNQMDRWLGLEFLSSRKGLNAML